MNRNVPPHFREIYPADVVGRAVVRVAAEITPWAKEVHDRTREQPLALCILRGAFLFHADLMKEIPLSIQPGFVRCQSYIHEENRQADTIQFDFLGLDIRGRHVLLVDDICDTGRTMKVLSEHLRENGAAEVRSAVLIHRSLPNSVFTPNYACFRYEGTEWFAGYGMEDAHWYMNYPAVYVMQPGGGAA